MHFSQTHTVQIVRQRSGKAVDEPLEIVGSVKSSERPIANNYNHKSAQHLKKLKDDFLISNYSTSSKKSKNTLLYYYSFPKFSIQSGRMVRFECSRRMCKTAKCVRPHVHVGDSSGVVMFALFSFLIGLKSSLLMARSGALLQFVEKSNIFFNLVEVLVEST